jgi:hypothetical protein
MLTVGSYAIMSHKLDSLTVSLLQYICQTLSLIMICIQSLDKNQLDIS